MKQYVSAGDFLDVVLKVHQKGLKFFFKKLNLNSTARVRAAFNDGQAASNWWMIPRIKQSWNKHITGEENKTYEPHVVSTHFKDASGLSLLSVGCGVGNHAIEFAQSPVFSRVLGIDLAEELISKANLRAEELGLQNCTFRVHDILDKHLDEEAFDVVLFHSSLHHFPNIGSFLDGRILPLLKKDGHLIMFEFVGPNRHQWTEKQLEAANQALKVIPKKYRKTTLPGYTKNRVRRPGIFRMLAADPSESIDSESILPEVHDRFEIVQENWLGGTLSHLVFKDIAHHFIHPDLEAQLAYEEVIRRDTEFVENQRQSDFIFGVYRRLE